MPLNKEIKTKSDFNSITIKLASPDSILERSHGEVKKPETINYRTYKPEMDGLFCERIFGPTKDYECYCGKYKRIRYKGIVCDRCGVEVTEKKVRRERMGHIKLVVPIVHIWYFKSLPNKIGYLLGLSSKDLVSIVYYERYAVVQPGVLRDGVQIDGEARNIEYLDLLSEEEYLQILSSLPPGNQALPDDDPNKFIAKIGGEAVKELLSRLDLAATAASLRHKASTETAQQRKAEALKRLSVVEAFREANERTVNRPEWTVMDYLPVIPPELRPLVPLDGGRFASSDLNDLYRRVIIRNNRLKRLIEIKAPDVILRNEKRMLQEAVDSLFDNSRKANAVKAEGGRALKSLTDSLKGKRGRFRQNLLGKRVDYSGRSVIVVGPKLQLHECGLPKDMAAELFKPFIIRKLIERGIVKTVKSAKKLVDKKEAVIWDILENVMKGHPVLLNRAPTLHRLSIQAFQPKLVEGKAINLHPLVCSAFNADFDGDQMAVHVPLSNAAVLEAQLLMLSSHNILNPQSGTPITIPSQDMVLGLYYITKGKRTTKEEIIKGEGLAFYSPEEVVIAFNEGRLDLHAWIKCKTDVREDGKIVNKLIETTVGRVIFNDVVPKEVGYVNQLLTKKTLKVIISDVLSTTNNPTTVKFLDDIKDLGFKWAFKAGLSFNIDDLIIPEIKTKLLEQAQAEVDEITMNYKMGLITPTEKYNQVIDTWTKVDTSIAGALLKEISNDKQGFNSVYMMLDSGARGSNTQIKQLAGLRGLMAKPRKSGSSGGEIIENPILSNFKDGLSVLEYFISTHGARKGLADTALKTADAGYLTRRLVDVAQDVVVLEEDCGTLRGLTVSSFIDGQQEDKDSLYDKIVGRTSLNDIYHPDTDELIVESGELIDERIAKIIEDSPIDSVEIRSVLTCENHRGVCVKCYGRNLATNRIAEIGDAVGIIAAQSIGEPGTQLTLRTFHTGGIASSIAAGSKYEAIADGKIEFDNIKTADRENEDGEIVRAVIGRTGEYRIVDADSGRLLMTNNIPYGAILAVKDKQKIKKGDLICSWDPYNAVIITEFSGVVEYENLIENITYRIELDEQTGHREKVTIESKDKKKTPYILIKDENNDEIFRYSVPVSSHISVDNGAKINSGHIIAKIPRIMSKVRDITGGLPRVTELFEARNPSNPARVSEIDGVVSLGKVKRGNREIAVEGKDGTIRKYLVPLTKHILVQEGDFVKAGMPLSDGSITPTDILDIKGPFALQEYLVNEIQSVYKLQGVKINDKHIEAIVRQMMRNVFIEDPGDTKFLEKTAVDKFEFIEQNDWIYDKKVVTDAGDSTELRAGDIVTYRQVREANSGLKRNDKKLIKFRDAVPATSSPLLLGITRSSLSTGSWISQASFQETTKVLNVSAISASQDFMLGLKENVIVGHRIPAGTGIRQFERIKVGSKKEMNSLRKSFDDDTIE